MTSREPTEYRPCVGVMLFNRAGEAGQVWVGRRSDRYGRDPEGAGSWWQMPQGGIDDGEDAAVAARRELYEETSIKSVEIIAESAHWYRYDLPEHLIGTAWGGRFRGQTQKWFACRFTGTNAEIDIAAPPGHKAEFDAWKWAAYDDLLNLIVPFKRGVYEQVIAEFRPLAG